MSRIGPLQYTNMEPHPLSDRVAKTEQEIAALAASQRAMANTVEQLAASVQTGFMRTESKMDSLATKVGDIGKPRWEAMGVISSVGVIVLGWFVTVHTKPIEVDVAYLKSQAQTATEVDKRLYRIETYFEMAANASTFKLP